MIIPIKTNEYELIALLKQIEGAISYDGDASIQVIIPLKTNKHIRIGITDDDVAEHPGLWYDIKDNHEEIR